MKDNRETINLNAACNPQNEHLFWSDNPTEQRQALNICYDCPVRAECYDQNFLLRGCVVGGTTPHQRHKIIQRDEQPERATLELKAACASWDWAGKLEDDMGLSRKTAVIVKGRYTSEA